MLIDTHAHLNFTAFDKDRKEIIKKCMEDNVLMINVGTKYETSRKAKEIAENYRQGIYAAIGLHPMHLATGVIKIKTDPDEGGFTVKGEDFDSSRYRDLAKSSKVVAIGEIGLDYYYLPETDEKVKIFKQKQKELLLEQLVMAKELNLPVIFHCRKAHDDLLEILREQKAKNKIQLKGVIHCFTGKWRQAKEYLDMGFYLGFNGIIFKLNLDKIIERTPLERILVETDCPYLTPPSFSEKRNNPLAVKLIVGRIAEIKGISYEKISKLTTLNAKKLFGI